MRGRSVLLLALLGAVNAGLAVSPAHAEPPALFRVGAAVADLTPAPGVPVYDGGFGESPALYSTDSDTSDPIQVRAIYISNATHAVEMAVIDSQGVFAAVQEADQGTGGLGSAGMRADAAAQIDALAGAGTLPSPAMTDADIIVQGSHSHSAPTVMGIWGPVDDRYLKEMHDRVVQALVQAAQNAVPAHLQWGRVFAPELDNVNTNQTDSYEGWLQDPQVSVLRAVSPSGATVATYANVPAHPDIVNGASLKVLTADYFGATRQHLEDQLGGTAIVGGATLGREESPIQVGGIARMENYSLTVSELLDRALSNASWVTDSTVASAETFARVPGTNVALFALNFTWGVPDPVYSAEASAIDYPINRANTPPYLAGTVVGTPVVALRVGRLAYVTLNGEAFPEVRLSIQSAVYDADEVVGLSLGNDQLGYYEPAFTWAWANGEYPYHSDHLLYNVSPLLGDVMVQTQVANLRALGFATGAVAVPVQMDHNYQQGLHPGVQLLAYPERGVAGSSGTFTVSLEGIFGSSAMKDNPAGAPTSPGQAGCASSGGAPCLHWDLGDGTHIDTPMVDSRHSQLINHAYTPGTYTVTASASDSSGDTTSWQQQVVVYPALQPSIDMSANPDGTFSYRASLSGGEGQVLAYRWSFADGSTAYTQSVTRTVLEGATVTITDGTGAVATATLAP